MHLKDWDPSIPPELEGEGGTAVLRDFVELGEGVVDLAGLRRGVERQRLRRAG